MPNNKEGVWVVIPAAGSGQRMQADCPKQYLSLAGKTVLEHTLDCFLGQPAIRGIVVVISADDLYWPQLAMRLQGFNVWTTTGGDTRAASVFQGLESLLQRPEVSMDDVILVHDAARPCLEAGDLALVLSAMEDYAECGALLATPVRDTLKQAQTGDLYRVAHTQEREGVWHALTPQMACLGVLHHALQYALEHNLTITDEASALEYTGLKPRLLPAQGSNIKITHPEDILLAEFLLNQGSQREEEQ